MQTYSYIYVCTLNITPKYHTFVDTQISQAANCLLLPTPTWSTKFLGLSCTLSCPELHQQSPQTCGTQTPTHRSEYKPQTNPRCTIVILSHQGACKHTQTLTSSTLLSRTSIQNQQDHTRTHPGCILQPISSTVTCSVTNIQAVPTTTSHCHDRHSHMHT